MEEVRARISVEKRESDVAEGDRAGDSVSVRGYQELAAMKQTTWL